MQKTYRKFCWVWTCGL